MENLLPILLSLTAIYVALYPEKSRQVLKQVRAKFINVCKQVEQPVKLSLTFSIKDIYVMVMDGLIYTIFFGMQVLAILFILKDIFGLKLSHITFFQSLCLSLIGVVMLRTYNSLKKTS